MLVAQPVFKAAAVSADPTDHTSTTNTVIWLILAFIAQDFSTYNPAQARAHTSKSVNPIYAKQCQSRTVFFDRLITSFASSRNPSRTDKVSLSTSLYMQTQTHQLHLLALAFLMPCVSFGFVYRCCPCTQPKHDDIPFNPLSQGLETDPTASSVPKRELPSGGDNRSPYRKQPRAQSP